MVLSQTSQFIIPLHSNSIVTFLDQVGRKLQSKGHRISYIPQNEFIAKTARDTISSEDLHLDYLNHEPATEFGVLCDKYGINSPKHLVFPQMVYDRGYDAPSYRHYWLSGTEPLAYDQYLELLHRTLDYLDILYENGQGGIPLQWQGAEVLRRALQRVADYHGYQSVRASFSPVPGNVLLRSTEAIEFPALQSPTYEDMSQEQRQEAQGFRDTVICDQKQVMGSSGSSESLYENLRRKVNRIKQYKRDIIPAAADWLRHRVAKRILGTIAERIYMDEQPSRDFIESHNYVFYPIQYLRESRVTMRAPAYYNQLWLIEYLSRSLPNGYELVVKDHPHQTGALPFSHIRAISRYATAIDPTIPARKVITQADAVVTLNNTVGYEAVMYGKPVVTLGDAFYSGAGYTREIKDPQSIPTALNNAVDSGGLSDEEVLEFAHGIINSSYDGGWGNNTPDNVEAFVRSIEEFL